MISSIHKPDGSEVSLTISMYPNGQLEPSVALRAFREGQIDGYAILTAPQAREVAAMLIEDATRVEAMA